jgi:DNA-binding response OmpR family regulator
MTKATILLIDDDPDFCESTRIMLEHDGYKVISAPDGVQGVNLAREKMPDLIVLDVVMPDKDGYVVCRELKDDPRTCHIPVIIVTSLGSDSEDRYVAKIAKYHMADAFFNKPLKREELFEKIEKIISASETSRTDERTRKRLLIVDDDPDIVAALERMLEAYDYEIFVAESGIEGIKLAQTFHPDAIVLDVMLPDKDGYTVCYELKKDPTTHNIPILILTALPHQLDRPEVAQSLAEDHLADAYDTKPIKAARFLAKITALVGES